MAPYNFPAQPTPFIGREAELTEIARLLADPVCRLLTIIGPGGMGKTRLAIEAARQTILPDGSHFVALQPLTSPEFIVQAVADALTIQIFRDADSKQQLLNSLSHLSVLLVMDNFEHLLHGVGLLLEILAAAPHVKLLVTSRERLNLQEEWGFILQGLSVPPAGVAASEEQSSAVQLFVQRAQQVRADFSLNGNMSAVRDICQQLEGMPLGLELAASWLRALTCEQVAAHMQSNLHFLTTTVRNIPERHRSLINVFEQSWRMLTATEQDVLMRLSVFRGSFDLEGAKQVANASLPVLAALADKSLIHLDSTGRYDLHEMLRQFADDKLLNAGHHEATNKCFCTYYLKLAEDVEAHNFGFEQVAWYDRVEREWDNLRVALMRLQEDEAGLRLAAGLGWFFSERAYWREGFYWLEQTLAANPMAPVSLRAKALNMAGQLVGGNYCEQSLALSRPVNDLWNIAWSLSTIAVGNVETDLDQSAAQLDECLALFRQLGDKMGLTHNLGRRSWIAQRQNDLELAQQLVDEAAIYAEEAGDRIMMGWVTGSRGTIASNFGRFAEAKKYLEMSLTQHREAHLAVGLNWSLIFLGRVELELGNATAAHQCYREALMLFAGNLSMYPFLPMALAGMAAIARFRGSYPRAAVLLGKASMGWMQMMTLDHFHVLSYDRDIMAVRAQLGDEAFEQAWAVWKAMTQQEAADYALADEFETSAPPHTRANSDPLTTRELEILRLMRDGFNSREIADKLVLSVSTIRWYLKQIYSKLDVHGRSEALARVRELKLLP